MDGMNNQQNQQEGNGAAASGQQSQNQQPPQAGQQEGNGAVASGQQSPQAGQQTAPAIDYAKIQQMLEGTLAAKEDTALKAYFKQQGLSQQEAEQAMTAFKAEKAKNQPDVNAMQSQLLQAQQSAKEAQLNSAATMAAVSLGIDAKTIPYLLKMADLSQVMGEDGKVNEETLKNVLNKVLEDVPALKPQAGSSGFRQIGADSSGENNTATEDAIKRAFGL